MLGKNLSIAAAGNAAEPVYVDDVFKTQLYRGNATADTDINQGGDGIDLASGGMVWITGRTVSKPHQIYDSARGISSGYLRSGELSNPTPDTNGVTSFNSDGFTLGNSANSNNNGTDYVAWCFKKSKGFFDVVTYDGSGTAQTVPHNLGSVPGMILIKRISGSGSSWAVYHRSRGATKGLALDTNAGESTATSFFNDTEPTSTVFTVGTNISTNNAGTQYVAYVFAHDDQSFGTDEDQSIIKCGSYPGDASTDNFVDLGFEPQWLMIKRSAQNTSGNWFMFDDMRGLGSGSGTNMRLYADAAGAESALTVLDVESKGFRIKSNGVALNAAGEDYIYMAIRQRNKPAESATEVFTSDGAGLSEAANRINQEADHRVDMFFGKHRTSTVATHFYDRFRGNGRLLTYEASAENATTQQTIGHFDFHTGTGTGSSAGNATSLVANMFKRAPGFFDIVRYRGNGVNGRAIEHSLGVAPEWIWVKNMDVGRAWHCWHSGLSGIDYYHLLQGTNPETQSTAYFGGPNSTVPNANDFTIGSNAVVNENGKKFVAYLWATLPGISKVGTYDGSSGDVDVDCGFTGPACFVMIKRITIGTTGNNIHYFDYGRGIVDGFDPSIKLNSNNAETSADYIDPINGGFRVNSNANVGDDLNTGSSKYIFMAIA